MFLNQRNAISCLILILALTLATFCSSKRAQPGIESTANSKVVSSTPPFQTREPDHYQAIRSISFTPASGGEPTVIRNVIAKDGVMRREEEIAAGSKRVVYLELPTGRFLLLPDERLYAPLDEESGIQDSSGPDFESPAELYLHSGPIQSTYESVGKENVNGRATRKYRVVVNNLGAETVNDSETLIWIDETLGMPIKSVTRSATGTHTMELSDVKMEVDIVLFQIPPNYQQVDARSLRQRLR